MAKTVIAITPARELRDRVLSSLGRRYKVWPVAGGEGVWRLMEEGIRPQLLVCPVRFDGASVLTFRARLMGMPAGRFVPIVVYATDRERSTEEVPLRVADRVVGAPIDEMELRRAAEDLLGAPTIL